MALKKVAMAEQSVGVCRYVVKPGPLIRMAVQKKETDTTDAKG